MIRKRKVAALKGGEEMLILTSLIWFAVCGMSVMFFYNGTFIANPQLYLILSFSVFISHNIIKVLKGERNKRIDRLVYLTMTVFISLFLSGLIYKSWTSERFISAKLLSNSILSILIFGGTYLNFMFMRAEDSYKKKRGNQRIKEQPQESIFEKWKDKRKSKDSKEIYITLGVSAENEDE